MSNINYRSDIDGLRAVAVLSVVLYHAFPERITGGFLGVDVFFVISGYLISLIILTELEIKQFSLLRFWGKRIRRIFPALLLVLCASLFVSPPILTPEELKQLGLHAASGAGFIANFVFWNESGYFDKFAIMKPLLHLWSLAIEEQFYLVWPTLLIFFSRFRIHLLALLLPALTCSFFYAFQEGNQNPVAAFYSPFTRAWELLTGATLAYLQVRHKATMLNNNTRTAISFVGLALVLYSVFLTSKQTYVQALDSIYPVLGTALILLSTEEAWVNRRILSNRLLVWFGLISYPLYLWHWPMLSFLFMWKRGEPTPVLHFLALALSVVLAWLTYKLIEQPIRRTGKIKIKVTGLITGLGLVGTTGFGIYSLDGFKPTLTPNVQWESYAHKYRVQGNTLCASSPIEGYNGDLLGCEFGDLTANKKVILYGDSHADTISDELNRTFKREGITGVRVRLPGCEPIPHLKRKDLNTDLAACEHRFQSLLSMMTQEKMGIILSIRWNFRLFPVPGHIDQLATSNSDGGKELEIYREYVTAPTNKSTVDAKTSVLKDFITRLIQTGQPVYLVYPVPEISWDIAKLNYYYKKDHDRILDEISIPYQDVINRNSFVNGVFDSIQSYPNLFKIKPEDIFCNTYIANRCVAQRETTPFYLDDDHLSDTGAAMLIERLMRDLVR